MRKKSNLLVTCLAGGLLPPASGALQAAPTLTPQSNIYSDADTHAGAGHIAQNVAFYGEEVNVYWKCLARTKV